VGSVLQGRSAFINDIWLIAETQAAKAAGWDKTTAVRADSAASRKQFASIVKLDDAVAEHAPTRMG